MLDFPSFCWFWYFPLDPNLWTTGGSSFHIHSTEETEGERENVTYPEWHSWWQILVPSVALLLPHMDCKRSKFEQSSQPLFCITRLELAETSEAKGMVFCLLCCFQTPENQNPLSIRQAFWVAFGWGLFFCAWRSTKNFSLFTPSLIVVLIIRSLLVTMNYCRVGSLRPRPWQNLFSSLMLWADTWHLARVPTWKDF